MVVETSISCCRIIVNRFKINGHFRETICIFQKKYFRKITQRCGLFGVKKKIGNFFEKTLDKSEWIVYTVIVVRTRGENHGSDMKMWEHSSAGRASALQAEGHRFEPYCSHHFGPIVQLVRTPPCHGGGREFESLSGRHYADLAHLVERHLAKVEVASSSLVIRSTRRYSQAVRHGTATP